METSNRIFELADKKYPEQRDFAAEIGVAPSVVSAWRNKNSIVWVPPQIAEILNTTVEYLLTGEKKEPAPTPKNGDELDRDTIMAAFIGGDMDMSPEEREALWDDVYEYARFKAEQWRKKKDQE